MPQTQLKDERPRTDEPGPVDRRKGEARTDIGERQPTSAPEFGGGAPWQSRRLRSF
jgi:hypothetical protein